VRTVHLDDPNALAVAADALCGGGVVIVPTDTVYGLAARPDDAAAVDRIYLAKDRPRHLHLPVLAASLDQVRQLGVEFSPAAHALASRWWPGPLTMAFGFSAAATARPPWLADRDEVAVRIPDYAFLLTLMRTTGALLVTSANAHGATTPTAALEAGTQLAAQVDLIVDAGTLHSVPSTVVNVHGDGAVVEREGAIGREAIDGAVAPRP
jgi:L-threonylcarbamoyladenylate synthase